MKKSITIFVSAALILTGCSTEQINTQPSSNITISKEEAESTAISVVGPFSDLRGGFEVDTLVLSQDEYNPDEIYTYVFNERTVFEGNEELQQKIVENGKNPGLGVRALHEQGITGHGVSVAIIDKPLVLEPPEFADRIVDYYECGYDFPEGEAGSMRGPAVTSILAGKTTGVAPEVTVYYAPTSPTD